MQIVGFIVRENKKVREIDINQQDIEKALVKVAVIGVTVHTGFSPTIANASTVTESVQPIINVLKDLAEPVSYGFMIKGFMKVMAGEEHEGMKVIKGAVGGYVGIQWIPMIFKLIKNIKF